MVKLLWADDQQDVVATFRSLLSSLKPKITTVSTGNSALELLKAQSFDILILDLMMPPDVWGGLWLLEQIANQDMRIPVVVLSGEGSQEQTIQALRLGAYDYVIKDRIQSELLPGIVRILDETRKDMSQSVLNAFPTPLAIPFGRFMNSIQAVPRLRRMIELYEATLRFSCLVGLAEISSSSISKNLVERVLQGPTMGTWNELFGKLGDESTSGSIFGIIHQCFDSRTTRAVIEIRNDLAHGAEPSESGAANLLRSWEDEVVNLYWRMWQKLRIDIIIPTSLSYDGTGYQVEGSRMVGDSIALPAFSLRSSTPLVCDQPYIVDATGSRDILINLHPLITAERANEPLAWRILVYDKVRGGKGTEGLNEHDPIHYVDIWTGERRIMNRQRSTAKDLPRIFREDN